MGRPRKQSRPQRRGLSRREFLKRSSALLLAASAAPLMQACGGGGNGSGSGSGSGSNPAPPAATTPAPGITASFQHGVASGDPLANAVLLWTRVTPDAAGTVDVEYTVASDPALAQVVKTGRASTDASRDYTVKVDVVGLQPGAVYYYRFSVAGRLSPIGRTRTLPAGTTGAAGAAGAAGRLRMAVLSCASLAHGYFNAYRRVAERADLDLVVHLGDYIYEYGSGQYGDLRAYEPPTELLSLADYRTRHAQYKRDPDLQELHRQHPMAAIWDDHEVANDDWSGGAENHTEGAEGTWAGRVAAALQAYYEWMPVRPPDPANLRKNNRSFSFGNLVDLILLEERLVARSQQVPTRSGTDNGIFTQDGAYADPARQMLGAEEESWLAARLRGSSAKWKLVGQGVMFAQLKATPGALANGGGTFINADQWDGYQPARDRVFDILKGNAATPPVGNVMILSGDIHSSWAADLSQDPNNSSVAAGGYDASTGAGSHAVECVVTAVTSPGIDDPNGLAARAFRLANPHFRHIDLERRGYLLLDADASRIVAEWWYVDTVESRSAGQSFGRALQVQDGANHLIDAAQTLPVINAPAPAP